MDRALEILGSILKWTVILLWDFVRELTKGIWRAVADDFR